MPTYEYACAKCGHQFEKFQPIAEKALTSCPRELCGRKTWGKGKVRRVIGAGAGLIFKGSGFYITDYRSENYKASASKEASKGSEGKGTGEGKSPAGEGKTASPKTDAAAPKNKSGAVDK